ncbi:MAG: YkvA family protein [bacterium]
MSKKSSSSTGYSPMSGFKLFRFLFHLPSFFKLFWRLFIDSRVPFYAKIFPVMVIVYIISPIDLVPAVLAPFLGSLDDIIVFFLGMKGFLLCIPEEIVAEHIAKIEHGM